jgi:hypothetical protein
VTPVAFAAHGAHRAQTISKSHQHATMNKVDRVVVLRLDSEIANDQLRLNYAAVRVPRHAEIRPATCGGFLRSSMSPEKFELERSEVPSSASSSRFLKQGAIAIKDRAHCSRECVAIRVGGRDG